MTAAAAAPMKPFAGLLGDTPSRNYSRKLRLFNDFAELELRRLIMGLDLRPGMRILDAGCGTGDALNWLLDEVGSAGFVAGIDLAAAHVQIARERASAEVQVLQGSLLNAPFAAASFDFIWCINTIHHFHDPVAAVQRLAAFLRPGGRIAIGQSALVPDMYFAWDSRLERVTNEAVRQYYRARYRLAEADLAPVRALLGVLRAARLENVSAQTVMIERVSPVDAATESYLVEAIFRDTWGERLRPYLSAEDYARLSRWCDPRDREFALARPDFHYLQSFTLMVGTP